MEKHIAEIIKVDIDTIVAETGFKIDLPVGTILETKNNFNTFFVVLQSFYEQEFPYGSVSSFGLNEEDLTKSYPHLSEYIRHLLVIFPLFESDGKNFYSLRHSIYLNLLLYKTEEEKLRALLFDSPLARELSLIDIHKYPKRNKAIVNFLNNVLGITSDVEKSELKEKIVDMLSNIFVKDFASLIEIVRGIENE
ncbi:MAG: hypothetical protein K6343_05550 [Caldisericaceae bacterium]